MNRLTRRDSLAMGAAAMAGGMAGVPRLGRAQIATSAATPPALPIETGAQLRVLRPSKFVDGDEATYRINAQKFTEATGVEVRLDFENWPDLKPKTAVAANVGTTYDIVLAWSDDPFKYTDKLLDLTDIATYLGQKYGGWWPIAERYGTHEGKWIAMPIGASGGRVVYRKSWVNEAGFETVPADVDGFLQLCTKLKENGHPAGFALGNAEGDGNSWCYWLLWAFGGAVVDEKNKVTLDSKETVEALKYAKALYQTFIPGTLSWLDTNNNKAFLAGELALTQNGISVYYAAKNAKDEAVKALAADIFHANMPTGPVGRTTERCLLVNQMVFSHTPYPNAAKAFLLHTMEEEQYLPWLTASIGYWNHPLQAYDAASIWTEDPKHTPYQHVIRDASYDGFKGTIGEASAAVLSDFVVVQMVASVCAGQATPEEAATEAARRAKRYYRA